jgi:hypothetical protein
VFPGILRPATVRLCREKEIEIYLTYNSVLTIQGCEPELINPACERASDKSLVVMINEPNVQFSPLYGHKFWYASLLGYKLF